MGANGSGDRRNLPPGDELIDPELLRILGCPLSPDRPPLRQEGRFLVCTECGAGFPIVDGIPNLLVEDAIPAEKMKETER
jgi:uncharacterized protein